MLYYEAVGFKLKISFYQKLQKLEWTAVYFIVFLTDSRLIDLMASLVVRVVKKNPLTNAGDIRLGFDPWLGKIPWRRAWQPTPVLLAGESHGQRSLVGYST